MKVGRFTGAGDAERLGVVVEVDGKLNVLDLLHAAEARRRGSPFPRTMDELIDAGPAGLASAYETIEWALRAGEAAWLRDEKSTPWLLPVRVRNCIATGRNFAKHVAEGRSYWAERGVPEPHRDIPTGFSKLPSVLVPTRTTVRKPEATSMLDYEVEAVAVIGSGVEGVTPSAARRAIWGYTVMNDLSARDWQRKEMLNQMILLGKNFPGFGPLGPWILTADEMPDPAKLVLSLSVNGQERQRANCDSMIFTFDEMVAHWSMLGLQRGDLVTSGTPEGVAVGIKPDPAPYFLKPGDLVHACVEQIGVLETLIT